MGGRGGDGGDGDGGEGVVETWRGNWEVSKGVLFEVSWRAVRRRCLEEAMVKCGVCLLLVNLDDWAKGKLR